MVVLISWAIYLIGIPLTTVLWSRVFVLPKHLTRNCRWDTLTLTRPPAGVGQTAQLYTGGSPQRTHRTRRRTGNEISSTLRAPHRGEGDQRRHLQQHRHRRTDGDFSRRATIRAGGRSSGAYAGRYRTQGRVRRQPQRRSPAVADRRTATTSSGGRSRSSGGRGSGSGWQRWRRG